MAKAGCRYIYVGLEASPRRASRRPTNATTVCGIPPPTRLPPRQRHRRHEHLPVGPRRDTLNIWRLPDSWRDRGRYPVYSLPVPIEGTPFGAAPIHRLLPSDLSTGDSAQLVFRPRHVSPDELEFALACCMRRSLFWRVARRVVRRLGDGWLPALNTAASTGYTDATSERSLERASGESTSADPGPAAWSRGNQR